MSVSCVKPIFYICITKQNQNSQTKELHEY